MEQSAMTEHPALLAVITLRFIPAFVSLRRGDGEASNKFNIQTKNIMKHSLTILFLCCFLALGCNNNPHGVIMVTGVVTLDGSPLEGATVTFCPPDGNLAAVGLTNEQGKFTLNSGSSKAGTGAQPGTYHVTVTKKKMEGGDAAPPRADAVSVYKPPQFINLIPVRYGDPETANLQAVVEKGKKNHFVYELKSE